MIAFFPQEVKLPDIERLLAGEFRLRSYTQITATLSATGQDIPIGEDELLFLLALSEDEWTQEEDLSLDLEGERRLRKLLDVGLVLSSDEEDSSSQSRLRDEAKVAALHWHPISLLAHQKTRWTGVKAALPSHIAETVQDLEAQGATPGPPQVGPADTRQTFELGENVPYEVLFESFGPPPPPFHQYPDALKRAPLPPPSSHGLAHALSMRKTSRAFDVTKSLRLTDLSTLLHWVWGCHGYKQFHPEVIGLKRTSPSGGGLHAVEVYPVVVDVEGLAPGIYHYNSQHHAVDLVRGLGTAGEARELLESFVAGQRYFALAQVSFIMTVRFNRLHWKYRHHARAYSVALMDAAHLSQTLYLVAGQIGLGAYVTAAINGGDIDDCLGLDGVSESAVLVTGSGFTTAETYGLEPRYEDGVPRT